MRSLSLSMQTGSMHAVTTGTLDGSRPVALLLHGGHGSWRHWRANLDSLSAIADPIAIDLPGYGESDDAPGVSSLSDYAALVEGALRSLPAVAVLVGFSFGTLVACELARRWRQVPGFRGAILISPPLGPEVTKEVLEILEEGVRETRRGGLLAGVAVTQRRIMISDPDRVTPELISDAAEQVRRSRFKSRPLSRSLDIRELIRQADCPISLLLGGQDPHQRSALAERLPQYRDLVGVDRVCLIPEAAHWLAYEHPQRVVQAVSTLLEQ